jgi:hypothetical protein
MKGHLLISVPIHSMFVTAWTATSELTRKAGVLRRSLL